MWGFVIGLVQAIWGAIFPRPATPPIAVAEAAQAAAAGVRAQVAQQGQAAQTAMAQAVADAPASQAAVAGALDRGAF